MREISAALQAAVATQGSEPDITLELADVQPHLGTVAVSGLGGPVAAAIAAGPAAQAGFDLAAMVDAQPQCSEPAVSFTLQQGEIYLAALGCLLGVYDGSWRVERRPGCGVTFGSVEQLHVLGKSASDPVQYTYYDEPEVLPVTHSGDRANRVVVFGPLTAPTAYSEDWDWADVTGTGQERLAIAVEPQTNTPAEAQSRGTLELAREQRFAVAVQASVQPNPALELCDVVSFEDGAIGAMVCRVSELHLAWYPREGHWDLVVVAGGR